MATLPGGHSDTASSCSVFRYSEEVYNVEERRETGTRLREVQDPSKSNGNGRFSD